MPEPKHFRAADARLITRVSAERAGLGDYVVKREFRRDVDQDIRREGYDYFWPNTTGDFATNPAGQPFPNNGDISEPITFVHQARRPNGREAILCGTPTKLWRFFGNEDGDYYDSDYFEPEPAANAPYYAVADEQWLLIGSGFSADGHRWEAVDINGYTVLNNGVDLPMTYRIEDSAVKPIYELREQGVAAVGTIGETNGILMCADISDIQAGPFLELMRHAGDIDSGDATASKEPGSNEVVSPADYFTAAHVGRTIAFDDGTTRQILTLVSARKVTVDGNTVPGINKQRFTLRNRASQTGSTFSGLISATSTGTTITASGAFFSIGMIGKKIRFSNGFSATISGFTSATVVTIDAAPPDTITDLPFWISDAAGYILTAQADAFDNSMVGRYIIFDSGEVRKIQSVTNSKTVVVDTDAPMAIAFFRIENPSAYAAFTDKSKIDRVQYRTIWSMPDEPRRFGSIVAATMAAGSQVVSLKIPTKSFAYGQEVIIAGAGVNGGNLTTNILSVTGLGESLLVDIPATTEIDEQPLEQSDAHGSIVGFTDLQDDSSAILRILALSDILIIYKETCIFTAVYTGNVLNPFNFTRLKMPKTFNLVYRWTLIDIGGQFHVYAGANSFYRFDLGSRVPKLIDELELVSDLFFSQATLQNANEIFSADNGVTNEVFFFYPSTGEKTLCFDYKSATASTTSIAMTAAATVKRPAEPNSQSESLFLMGNAEGTLVVYGRADAPQSSWGNKKEIFYRRSAYPFSTTKFGYEGVIETGWEDFGDAYHAKDISAYILHLASQSQNNGLTVVLSSTRNPSEAGRELVNHYITSPRTENLIPLFFRDHFFKMKLVISGKDNPCRLTRHTFDVAYVGTESHERRSS